MELHKNYCINLISTTKTGYGSFVAVENFNSNASQHFQNYYKSLMSYNSCGEWFQNLDYPQIEIGNIVLVQINKQTDLWARGIITNLNFNRKSPKIYLIDYQIFCDDNVKMQWRVCPPKFSRLILPTYSIDVNMKLNNDDLKCAIKMLIHKNQHGELSFNFIPKSVQNNIYTGELIVNNKIDNSSVPLKKLLKNIHTIKYFGDISSYKHHKNSIFNPFKTKYMRKILNPRDPNSIVFLNINSHLNDSNYSLENLSESSDEFSSTSDFSDDSNPSDESSSYSSIISTNDSSLHSHCTSKKKYDILINSAQNIPNKIVNENIEHQETTVLDTTKYNDENINISSDVDNSISFCCKSVPSDIQSTISQIEQCNIDNNKIEKENCIMNMPMKKNYINESKLSEYKYIECQENRNASIVHEVMETPKMVSNLINETKKCNDSIIWWSSDDEN